MPNLSVLSPVNDDIEETLIKFFKEERASVPLVLPDDPVALACASYRRWLENSAQRWSDLDTVEVIEADRIKAQELRSYYRGLMTFQQLKSTNGNMSTFRRKLYALVTNQLVITKEEIGLLHRLPYFYAEDLALDEVYAATSDTKSVSVRIDDTEIEFQPLKRILKSRRSGDYLQFWFTADRVSQPCVFMVKTDNVLLPMMEGLFARPRLTLQVDLHAKQLKGYHRDRVVYFITRPRLV